MRHKTPMNEVSFPFCFILSVLLCAPLIAGSPVPKSASIAQTFTSTSQGGFSVSISKDGNVLRYEAPFGYEHLSYWPPYEGYAVCYKNYSKIAYDNGNVWLGFEQSSPLACSGNQCVIVRKIHGCSMRLTMTLTFQEAGSLTIETVFANLSAKTIPGVRFVRISDMDVDAAGSSGWNHGLNNWGRSADRITAWVDPFTASIPGKAAHALSLSYLQPEYPHTPIVSTGGNFCSPNAVLTPVAPGASHGVSTEGPADYRAFMLVDLGDFAPFETKTVLLAYEHY